MPEHIKVELDFTPVEEGLPDDNRYYIVLEYGEWPYEAWAKCDRFGEWTDNHGNQNIDVSHWTDVPSHPLTNAKE